MRQFFKTFEKVNCPEISKIMGAHNPWLARSQTYVTLMGISMGAHLWPPSVPIAQPPAKKKAEGQRVTMTGPTVSQILWGHGIKSASSSEKVIKKKSTSWPAGNLRPPKSGLSIGSSKGAIHRFLEPKMSHFTFSSGETFFWGVSP